MGALMDVAITRPLGIILMELYNLIGSYGIAIIIFTVVFRLVLMPLTVKTKRSTAKTAAIQPKIQELQKKYKNNREKLGQEMQKLYKEEGVNPMGGCLPMLVQFPIMIALYYVVQQPLKFMMGLSVEEIAEVASRLGIEMAENARTIEITLANEIYNNFNLVQDISPNIVALDYNFLGINLAQTPDIGALSVLWLVPIISAATSYLYSFLSQRSMAKTNPTAANNPMAQSMKTTMLMMPLMSAWFAFMLPTAVGIYWITGNVMLVVQEYLINWYLAVEKKRNETVSPGNNKPTKK